MKFVQWLEPMLLKPDRTGRLDRLDREPVTAPVRTLAVNRQSAKPVKISEKPSRTISNRLNHWTGGGFGKPAGPILTLKKKKKQTKFWQNKNLQYFSFFFPVYNSVAQCFFSLTPYLKTHRRRSRNVKMLYSSISKQEEKWSCHNLQSENSGKEDEEEEENVKLS
jgi:hypothetical protein